MTILTTDRLTLRPLALSDAEAITTQIGNYAVSRNLARVPYPYALSDAHWFLDWIQTFDERSLFAAITEKPAPDRLIGAITFEYAAEHDNAELGYWLAQPYWNRGYMREAARAVVDHAFSTTKLNVLVSCFFNENPNSGKVLRGAGFEQNGLCMHYSKSQGVEVPVTEMRITRERWLHLRQLT